MHWCHPQLLLSCHDDPFRLAIFFFILATGWSFDQICSSFLSSWGIFVLVLQYFSGFVCFDNAPTTCTVSMMHQQGGGTHYSSAQAGSQHYQGQQPIGMLGQGNQGNSVMAQRPMGSYRSAQQGKWKGSWSSCLGLKWRKGTFNVSTENCLALPKTW